MTALDYLTNYRRAIRYARSALAQYRRYGGEVFIESATAFYRLASLWAEALAIECAQQARTQPAYARKASYYRARSRQIARDWR